MDSVLVSFAGIAHEFEVSQILDLGFTQVRWYGAIIAFGYLLAVLFGGRIAYTWEINLDYMIDILIGGTIGAVIGARAYYVAFEWDYYSRHIADIPKIWEGGMAIYGGIIGGLLCGLIVCRLRKINIPNLLDLVGMSLLIGQGIGRWGNYANQEAFGTFTYKNFGMMSDTVVQYIAKNPHKFGLENVENVAEYIAENNLFVHPTFFYESVWCILGFVLLYITLKKFRKFSGQIFLMYGVWYGLERAIVEGLRTDSLYVGNTGLRASQLLSIAIVAVCGILLAVLLVIRTKHPKEIEGVDYFYLNTKTLEHERKKAQRKAVKAEKRRAKGKRDWFPKRFYIPVYVTDKGGEKTYIYIKDEAKENAADVQNN